MFSEGKKLTEIIKEIISFILCEILMIEAQQFGEDYRDERLPNGKQRFVLNGWSECIVLTDIG
jgi:hypothetical protein